MEGLELLKSVTKPEWLKQPEQPLTIFEVHPAKDARYDVWRNPSKAGLWQYDKHAAYLACASSVYCGIGNYAIHTNIPFMKQAGLWHVDMLSADLTWFYPDLLDQWLYTPELAFLAEIGVHFSIHEAYIFPEQHYVLRAFYEHLKARREQGENIKHLYTQAFGMLAHKPSRIWKNCVYRPDWHSLLVSECKARMLRHAWQVHELEGIWPVAIKNIDSLYYTQQVHSLRMGEGIGAFKETRL